MNPIRNLVPLVLLAAALVLPLSSCRTLAAEGTPPEIQAVPTSQSLLLESAIDSIEAGDPAWVNPETGNVLRDAILAVLRADKSAWEELDRFYNPDTAPAAATTDTE